MSNTDLINAYFRNEMTVVEKQEFENNLQRDVALKKEFDFQKEIIEAVQIRRKAQLKAMLDKVPVSGGHSGNFTAWSKAALAVAVTGLVGLGTYLLWPEESTNEVRPRKEITVYTPEERETEPPIIEEQEPEIRQQPETSVEKKAEKPVEKPVSEEESQHQQPEEAPTTPEIKKPDMVPSFDTPEDAVDSLEAPGNTLSKQYSNHSSLDVEINDAHKKFNFHYQFKGGKLLLFGAFDQGLYEILEINERDGKTLFLYYKDNFYHLRPDETKIVPLEPVKQQSLIEQLKRARE